MYGQRILELRKEKGWTQAQLAERLHCSPRTVGRYEGERRDLGTATLIALCTIFEVSADYLLGLEDEFGGKRYR